MIKLLIGGSPCTYWSIAQKNNRETTAEGLGWELFKNYLIAKEKFKPDFFLYENNKSAAQAIKDQIKHELGVWDGTLLMRDTGARYIEINSALVSAQNRQRFYVHNCGEVGQPEDRGILLKDILEGGVKQGKTPTLTANGKWVYNNQLLEPICVQEQVFGRKVSADGTYDRRYKARTDGKSGTLTVTNRQNAVAEPIRIPPYGNDDKSRPIRASYAYKGTGVGSLQSECFPDNPNKQVSDYIATPVRVGALPRPTDKPVYEVKDGLITIKDKQYPIKLPDSFYIIRKLTVTECERLQTLPDGYTQHAGVSETQCYKGIGNGWTAEVIIHILSNALKNVPKDEKIIVLSMYDGIGTGRYCLDKMGFTNVEYHAYEIDKYAMKIALSNYPDIIQHGDAFQVRSEKWNITNN